MRLLLMHNRSDILAGRLAAVLLSMVEPVGGQDGDDGPFWPVLSEVLVKMGSDVLVGDVDAQETQVLPSRCDDNNSPRMSDT